MNYRRTGKQYTLAPGVIGHVVVPERVSVWCDRKQVSRRNGVHTPPKRPITTLAADGCRHTPMAVSDA